MQSLLISKIPNSLQSELEKRAIFQKKDTKQTYIAFYLQSCFYFLLVKQAHGSIHHRTQPKYYHPSENSHYFKNNNRSYPKKPQVQVFLQM